MSLRRCCSLGVRRWLTQRTDSFTKTTGITEPRAWTMSQFIAANIASAALVSSNPTNILIAGVSRFPSCLSETSP